MHSEPSGKGDAARARREFCHIFTWIYQVTEPTYRNILYTGGRNTLYLGRNPKMPNVLREPAILIAFSLKWICEAWYAECTRLVGWDLKMWLYLYFNWCMLMFQMNACTDLQAKMPKWSFLRAQKNQHMNSIHEYTKDWYCHLKTTKISLWLSPIWWKIGENHWSERQIWSV